MPSSDASLYERGDALEPDPDDAHLTPASSDEFSGGTAYQELSTDEYWSSLAHLIRESYRIDNHLNEILEKIYDCQPAFYSASGKHQLQNLLDELHEARQHIRALEQDAEELAFSISKSYEIETQAANTIDPAVSGVKRTYDRAYNLCLYKLDSMNDGWITATNLLISIIMIVLTLLFWMEFWE